MSTLAMPISARAMMRSGGNRTSQSVGRAVASAARSADSTAHVFGSASASTKKITTLRTKASRMPHQPLNTRSARSDVRNAWPVCRTVMLTRIGLMNSSGSPASSDQGPRRLRVLLLVDGAWPAPG